MHKISSTLCCDIVQIIRFLCTKFILTYTKHSVKLTLNREEKIIS